MGKLAVILLLLASASADLAFRVCGNSISRDNVPIPPGTLFVPSSICTPAFGYYMRLVSINLAFFSDSLCADELAATLLLKNVCMNMKNGTLSLGVAILDQFCFSDSPCSTDSCFSDTTCSGSQCQRDTATELCLNACDFKSIDQCTKPCSLESCGEQSLKAALSYSITVIVVIGVLCLVASSLIGIAIYCCACRSRGHVTPPYAAQAPMGAGAAYVATPVAYGQPPQAAYGHPEGDAHKA
jgi:hypothetical protein